jgi:hypothetical protein
MARKRINSTFADVLKGTSADHSQVTSGMVVVSAEYVQVKTRLLPGEIFADGLLS